MFDGAISVLQEDNAVAIEVLCHMTSCDPFWLPWQLISSIQWTADSVSDMYADAVLAVILQIESNPDGFKG